MSEETIQVTPYHDMTSAMTVEISVADLEALGFTRTVVKPWKPVEGERYWFIDAQGRASLSEWEDDRFDIARWDTGNCYQTEAEAAKAQDKQLATVRVLRRLRELEGDWVADWSDDNQDKSAPCYVYSKKAFESNSSWWVQRLPSEWHSSEEAWEQVFKELEQDIKLMMGVE